MSNINELPNETLARIISYTCGSQPSSAFHTIQVSKRWNDATKAWALSPNFYKSLDNFNNPDLFPGNKELAAHIHISDEPISLNQKTQACMARIAPVLSCLQIWVGPDTSPFLSSDHPNLLQLVLSRPPKEAEGDGSGEKSAAWIPPPTAAHVPWMPKLRSLHLINPYPEVLAALSVTPSFPNLIELCVTITSFGGNGRETLSASLTKLLNRVSGTLETLTLRTGILPPGVPQPAIVRLDSLKEFNLCVLDDMGVLGHALPFNLLTPKLEKYIDIHSTYPGLYHTETSQVTTLADWSPELHFASYDMFPKVQTIYVATQGKINQLKTHLQSHKAVCPALKLIVMSDNVIAQPSEVDWKRDETTTIKVRSIPADQTDAYQILTQQPWACNACTAPHEHQ